MLRIRIGGAAVLLVAFAVSAQTPPPTTPPPKSPATGGTQPAPKSPGAGGKTAAKPTVIFPTDISRVPEVSKSVELSDRQQTQLNLMTERLQNRYREQFERLASLPEADRADRTLLLNREYVNTWLGGAADVLNERQLTRFRQLQTQFGGFASLSDPVVQKSLGLTDAQIRQIGENVTWSNQQLAAVREQAALDQARAIQMFNAYNVAAQERLNAFLTLEQQRAWAQLTGDPFTFPPPFPFTPPAGTGPKR